jgi:hypothetical protein
MVYLVIWPHGALSWKRRASCLFLRSQSDVNVKSFSAIVIVRSYENDQK